MGADDRCPSVPPVLMIARMQDFLPSRSAKSGVRRIFRQEQNGRRELMLRDGKKRTLEGPDRRELSGAGKKPRINFSRRSHAFR